MFLRCVPILLLTTAAASTASITFTDASKKLKICSIVGGLDLIRLRSYETRRFFLSAVEDIEMVREYLSEASLNGGQVGPHAGLSSPDALARTLDKVGRGLSPSANLTTLDLGLGWTDDSPNRRVERWITTSTNKPLVGSKAADMALVSSVSNILPWILDRRSSKENWWINHSNGRSTLSEQETIAINAIWVHSYSDAIIYYPPFSKFAPFLAPPNQTALTLADIAGGDFNGRTQGATFTEMAWPENNPNKTHVFLSPYPDQAQVGESTFTLIAPVYLTGNYVGNVYNNTFFGTAGIDIKTSAVSALFADLDDQLTSNSFALLASVEDFSVIAISQYAVNQLYPFLTGMEESRPEERRNMTYMPSDTIFQTLLQLENGEWNSLKMTLENLPRGRRDSTKFNVTITGDDSPTEFYVMYDRWDDSVADWALLVFSPVQEVDEAIFVALSEEEISLQIKEGANPMATTVSIKNSGRLDVLVSAIGSSTTNLIDLHQPIADLANTLKAGEQLDIVFSIKTGGMAIGKTSTFITFSVQDDDYSDCFFSKELSLRVSVDVIPEENLNQLDKIRPVGLTLAGLVIAFSTFFAACVFYFRNVQVIKASQPIFLLMVCFGTLLLGSTIIPLSVDDSIASTRGCDIACMAAPWLLSLGFTTVFAALYSKIWRINKIFRNAKGFKRVKVSEKDVLAPFLVLFILNVILLIGWTAVDPLHWVRSYQDGRESLNSSYGYCTSENRKVSLGFGISLVLINISALILANVEAYMARNISDEFSESKYIGVAMALTLQSFVIGIPVLFLVGENPTAKFFVSSGIIFAVSISILLLLFIPKTILYVKQKRSNAQNQSGMSNRPNLYSSMYFSKNMRCSQNTSQHDSEGMKYIRHDPQAQVEFNEYKRKVQDELYGKLKQGMDIDQAFHECGIDTRQISYSSSRNVSALPAESSNLDLRSPNPDFSESNEIKDDVEDKTNENKDDDDLSGA